jgi:hypothetical protein
LEAATTPSPTKSGSQTTNQIHPWKKSDFTLELIIVSHQFSNPKEKTPYQIERKNPS